LLAAGSKLGKSALQSKMSSGLVASSPLAGVAGRRHRRGIKDWGAAASLCLSNCFLRINPAVNIGLNNQAEFEAVSRGFRDMRITNLASGVGS
jgi:hypothetical protein